MIEPQLNNKEMKDLYKAFLQVKTSDECKRFLRDLCTLSELDAMSERFQVAKQVNAKKTYRDISKATSVSTATITRVAQYLHHGMGGYKLVLDRMKS
ncbi:MAG: YerC/YecD family TrpR-related protein [bacterium]|nr:YerC/YecD family TrpR-related protein [bacterium]